MTAKKKAPAKKAATKRPPKQAAVKKPDVERLVDPKNPGRFINDTRGPTAPVLGHFVDVVDGEHKGRYGVLQSVDETEKYGVVRTRDARTDLLNVEVKDLLPAQSGRR